MNIATIIASIILIVITTIKKTGNKSKYVPYCMFAIQLFLSISNLTTKKQYVDFGFNFYSFEYFLGYNIFNLIGLGFLLSKKKKKD